MDRFSQLTSAFAVHHADCQDVFLPACVQVIREQILDFSRAEGVKIEFAGNRKRDRFLVLILFRPWFRVGTGFGFTGRGHSGREGLW